MDLQQQRAVRPDRELRGAQAVLRRDDHELRGVHDGVSVYDAREHLFAGDVQRQRFVARLKELREALPKERSRLNKSPDSDKGPDGDRRPGG